MTHRSSLVLALSGLFVVLALRACWDNHRLDQLRAENAQLRSEAAQSRLHAAGYQTTLAHITTHLRQTLADRDHWRALAEEPDARPVALVAATATARAHIEAPAEPVVDSATRAPAGYAGEYADSVFRLRWTLLVGPPPTFRADLRARLPLELVGYRLPDGSYGVTAESPDPRVRIEVKDFVMSPPEPERRGIPWTWIAGTAVLAVVGWEMIR